MKGQAPEDKAAAAAAELRAATRAAHEVVKDLRAAIRDGRAFLDAELGDAISGVIDETVRAGLDHMGDEIKAAMDAAVDKVGAEFDQLAALLMGEDDPSKPSLKSLVRGVRAREADVRAHLEVKAVTPKGGPVL